MRKELDGGEFMHVDFLLFVVKFISQIGLGVVYRKVESILS